jgi:hypothetical protein
LKTQSKTTQKTGNPVDGGAPKLGLPLLLRGPKLGALAKEVSQTQAPTQAYEAAAQVRSGCIATA